MKKIQELLQKEIEVLREILSNLKQEEDALLSCAMIKVSTLYKERVSLKLLSRQLRKERISLQKEASIPSEEIEEQSLFSQLKALLDTIKSQMESNRVLKKNQNPASCNPTLELKKESVPKKKKILTFEEDNPN